MQTTKNLVLAALTALSVGVGTAIAQESAGGADVNSQPAFGWTGPVRHAAPATAQPPAGSSDVDRARTPTYPEQVLIGGDGNA